MKQHVSVQELSASSLSPSSSRPLEILPGHRKVRFALEHRLQFIESRKSNRRSTRMAKQIHMIDEAAKLFNENYGTWGPYSEKPGKPVKLSTKRLREQYLADPASSDTRVTVDGILAGNAFVCRWKYQDSIICWVTQLIVHKEYRDHGLATSLLRSLRLDTDDIYGLMSSHPHACLAAAKSFGTNAAGIIGASPVSYIKDAKLCGDLFDPDDTSGLISGVNTFFFVDHEEPLQALTSIQQDWKWPFGSLPEGKEFLLLLKTRQSRSRSSSASGRDPANPSG
ncbi:hypothetical protein B0T26DRAFT_772653 [Lasiosphaeria miniovina]|uniref:N-acetyltransferase domain-containing protein n=1 Tax=Lasiosphaeria miniovina TaxID=1954250 RepID=A0AA40AWG2_9PEZI|nr:uncharacterized protein B0T26DRAFT_772653 [Lasiosphaeria miniovina]KAK0723237.1 hypothetical protein B0T26DRAFT_772653 [Lasiosphaeria miniovina]